MGYPGNLRHGLYKTPEYRVWCKIKERCYNSSRKEFPRYGGRGIRLCDEWLNNPAAFVDYVGQRPSPRHSIDRIDNEGNYEPGNVRWATPKEQSRNTRRSKLDSNDVGLIRYWLKAGYKHKRIAEAFSVSRGLIGHIRSGRTWAPEGGGAI